MVEYCVPFSSKVALKPLWFACTVLGLINPQKMKFLYYCYSILVHTSVTIFYPLTLTIEQITTHQERSILEILEHLNTPIGSILVVLKIGNLFVHRGKLFAIQTQIEKLDCQISGSNEKVYMDKLIRSVRNLFKVFLTVFAVSISTIDLPTLYTRKVQLIYPAWFPWNVHGSPMSLYLTHFYQLVGIVIVAFEDLICITYPGILLWILAGHLRALGLRAATIGYDVNIPAADCYKKLLKCIEDHKTCLKYFKLYQDMNSTIMLIQLIATQLMLCTTAIRMTLLKDNIPALIYSLTFFSCTVLEITLSCYAGSILIQESDNFTFALYSCNWKDMDSRFKNVLIIFMQSTQKPLTFRASALLTVSLATWLKVLRSAYSLYAVFN